MRTKVTPTTPTSRLYLKSCLIVHRSLCLVHGHEPFTNSIDSKLKVKVTVIRRNLSYSKKTSGLPKALCLAAIFFILILVSSLHRYYSFYASYDQGLFNQLFWNSIHGHLFQGSLSSGQSSAVGFDGQVHTVSYYHLGQHFVPDFLLWLPIYKLFIPMPKLCRCSLAHYILGTEVMPAKRNAAQELFSPVFSSLLDALLFRAQE